MYNYSPGKLTLREREKSGGSGNKRAGELTLGSLDYLPAVPDRHSSASLFDSLEQEGAGADSSQRAFNLYDKIDSLCLDLDSECGDSDARDERQRQSQSRGGNGKPHRDEFQSRMDDIEQTMTGLSLPRFKLPDRPLKLSADSDVFADIDRSNTQRLEIFLPKVSRGDVLCIDVCCVPSDMRTFDLMDVCEGSYNRPVDHEPLDVQLAPAPPTQEEISPPGVPKAKAHAPFVPVYHNGEYEFNLTSAHGISSGRYVLSVHNKGAYTQSVRCKMKLRSYVQATTIEAQEVVTVHDVPQEEFCFFRFVLKDRSNFVSIRLTPRSNATGTASDPDLYVSNKYAGLVAVDRDNYIWRSTNIGLDQVDIHPDDLNAQRSGIFIIGVLGYRGVNSFSLEIRLSPPVRCIDLKPGGMHDLVVRTDRYTFYRIPVDHTVKSKLIVTVSPVDNNGYTDGHLGSGSDVGDSGNVSSDLSDMDQHGKAGLENQFGRGVYTADGLVSSGVFANREQYDFSNSSSPRDKSATSIEEAIEVQLTRSPQKGSLHSGQGSMSPNRPGAFHITKDKSLISHQLSVLLDSLPNSIAKNTGIFPVIHLSSSCMYPTADSHTWRASSILGPAKAMIETDEWLHTSARFCYLSVIGVALPTIFAPLSSHQEPSRDQQDRAQDTALSTPQKGGDSQGFGRVMSPILPTMGAAPMGSADGRFIRSQNTIMELKARTESENTLTHLQQSQEQDFLDLNTASYSTIKCKISLDSILDSSDLPVSMQMRYKLFCSIYDDVDGSSISQKDRMNSGDVDTPSLTYGEIEFPSFVRMLEDVGAREGQVFVDLGSGTGKAVVAAALSGTKFLRCIGIEMLPGLSKASRVAIENCKSKLQTTPSTTQHRRFSHQRSNDSGSPGAGGSPRSAMHTPMMEIWEGDISVDSHQKGDEWWSQADIVFCSSICFSDALIQDVLNLAKNMKRGGILITLKLPEHFNAQFKLVTQKWVKMSWGRSLVYVLRRL